MRGANNFLLGSFSGPQKAATLQADTELTKAAAYEPLIIAYRNGAPVRLGDVARVVDSVQSDKGANWFNGVRAMSVPVLRQADANTVEVANRIKALLPAIRAELPGAIDIAVPAGTRTAARSGGSPPRTGRGAPAGAFFFPYGSRCHM